MYWLRNAALALLMMFPLFAYSATANALASPAWSILVDESAQLTLDEVQLRNNRFQPLNSKSIHFPSSSHAVWLSASIPSLSTQHWLWLYSPRAERLDYYLVHGNQIKDQISSNEAVPLHSRALLARSYLFPIPKDGEAHRVYIRLSSAHPLTSQFDVLNESQLAELAEPAIFFTMLIGALILLAFYSLITLIYTDRRTGFWLAGLNLSLALCAAANLGLLRVWLPELTFSPSRLSDLSALAATFFVQGFALSFLSTSHQQRWSHNLLKSLMLLTTALTLFIASQNLLWSSTLVYSVLLFTSLMLSLISGYQWYQGYRPARFICMGMLIFSTCLVLTAPSLQNYSQITPSWTANSLLGLATLSCVLLCVALAERRNYHTQQILERHMRAAANSAEIKAKAEFLAKISHEIRTPMNGVLGMTELLLSSQLSAKQRDYVHTINSAGNDLLHLINEILDISRLESGQIEVEHVPFDLIALVDECVAIWRNRSEKYSTELISFIPPQVPRIISSDPSRLRQTLLSLLDNAYKQNPEGEIVLAISLDNSHATPHLRIAVQDSGPSLSLQEKNMLLTAELQRHDLLTRDSQDGHLRLIIARQLIRLMGGNYGIQPGSPSGNTFWLTLPLGITHIQPHSLDVERELQGMRVLVVDDNETCRKLLVQQCSSWGMSAMAVASGKEALALLRTKAHIKEYFDVVLLDQGMPSMSGLQLAAKIKGDPNLNHDILLIMLSGDSNPPSKIHASNAGISFVLSKPVAGYTLKATLADELQFRRQNIPKRPAQMPTLIPTDFRILVAEDNSISTKVIQGMLNKLALQPDTASNGAEALDALKNKAYDLVLMDCEMPILDGFSATEQLRLWEQAENKPRTPVVALTAHILPEHQERARNAGMDGHMAKPIELSHLREVIAFWASQQERLKEPQPPEVQA